MLIKMRNQRLECKQLLLALLTKTLNNEIHSSVYDHHLFIRVNI